MTQTSTSQAQADRDKHRARYAELQAQARNVTALALPQASSLGLALDAASVLHTETLPGGWYWITRVLKGESLRIANPSGASSVAMLAWAMTDTSERLNLADTIKLQWSAAVRKGRLLLTDMGRVAFSVVEDSSGAHDTVVGSTTPASIKAAFGDAPVRDSRSNFLAAAAKLGLTRRDLHACVSFFSPVGVDAEGRFVWHGSRRRAGDFIDLRAEMDLWVVLSNAGHPCDPSPQAEPAAVEVTLFRAPTSPADPCRQAGPEAERAFEFTERHTRKATR